jgi:hyperosmotically inducible protein
MNKFKKIIVLAAILSIAVAFAACDQEGPAEKAGKKIDNAVEKAGEKIDEATEAAGDKLEEAGDKLDQKTN